MSRLPRPEPGILLPTARDESAKGGEGGGLKAAEEAVKAIAAAEGM